MTLKRIELDTKWSALLHLCKNLETEKLEILAMFLSESEHEHQWTEQDIIEQMRKIIYKYS